MSPLNMRLEVRNRMLEIGHMRRTCWLEDGRSHVLRNMGGLQNWEWPLGDNQQGTGDFCPTNARSQILPTWMSLVVDFSPVSKWESLVYASISACDRPSREPIPCHARLRTYQMMNKPAGAVLSYEICGNLSCSNRKRTCLLSLSFVPY